MKLETIRSLGFLLLMSLSVSVGCGGAGGAAGDPNDPAVNGEDEASMSDETGTFSEDRAKKKSGGAEGG